MQIITGQSARKENFWKREKEITDILNKIEVGEHVLLVAPRRVGKTSIMHNLLDYTDNDKIYLYIDTESADNEQEFWKKLFHKLMDEEFINTLKHKAHKLLKYLSNINITEISAKGIKFGDSKELNYLEIFKEIIKNLDPNKKLIIMIDEFAQTIDNIIRYENLKSARSLLLNHRELRQDKTLSSKITIIYAGSIGLESVTSKMDCSALINDLSIIKINPLELEDAKMFIQKLSQDNNINIGGKEIEYILLKIKWLIPFYIQLIMDDLRRKNEPISIKIIDNTFTLILNNRNHFDHWHTRLKNIGDNEYKCAKEVLNIASKDSLILKNKIINIGEKHNLSEEKTSDLIRTLVYDGYINNNGLNTQEYIFNSPILEMWWNKNVAN